MCGLLQRFTQDEVRACFGKSAPKCKSQVVQLILADFPEFGLKENRPPVRKPWMSEDSKMSIFDAIALALTYDKTAWRKAAKAA